MSQSRQLAAIMFTDIVGYMALMGNDEQNAFTIADNNHYHPNITEVLNKITPLKGDH